MAFKLLLGLTSEALLVKLIGRKPGLTKDGEQLVRLAHIDPLLPAGLPKCRDHIFLELARGAFEGQPQGIERVEGMGLGSGEKNVVLLGVSQTLLQQELSFGRDLARSLDPP